MRTMLSSVSAVLVLALGLTGGAGEKGKPRPKTLRGELSKIEGGSLTITLRGDSGERHETVKIAAETRILVESAEDEKVKVKGEGGEREIVRPKVVPAKLADLKVGQRISATFVPDQPAIEIIGHRAAKPRKEGDG